MRATSANTELYCLCERFPHKRVKASAEDLSEHKQYNSNFTIKQSKCYII